MNAVDEAAAMLVAAFDPILPGRVHPYRPARFSRGVAPAIWLDEESGVETFIGSMRTCQVTFPVTCLADGADHAAQAMARGLAAAVWDASVAIAGVNPTGWSPTLIAVDPNVTLRARIVDVAVTVSTRTLCAPAPVESVPIPPQPVAMEV